MDLSKSPTERIYWCFISYRHADNKASGRQWASWIHQAIETYEVPEDLIGTVNNRGDTIPERIFPVFRDEEELPADADLARPIEAALANSKTVLVLCSPRAVQSQYVAQEIHEFKKLGRSDRIMAALIDGEPNSSRDPSKDTEECFPTPLMHPIDEDGNLLTDEWAEPIAADFRLNDGSEGWTSPTAYRQALEAEDILTGKQIDHCIGSYSKSLELAKIKIIAGIIGVPLGTLTQRDKAYQLAKEKRKARVFRAVAGAMALLAVVAVIAGFFAVQKQKEAERQKTEAIAARDDAEGLIRFLTQDLAEALSGYFPINKRREVSKRVSAYLAKQQENEQLEVSEQSWSFLLRLAQIYQEENRTREARKKFEQSFNMAKALQGQEGLAKPWQAMAGESGVEWAMLELNDSHAERVKDLGQESLNLYLELLTVEPDTVEWKQGKANGLTLIADGAMAQGELEAARKAYQQQYQIRLQLYKEDPKNQLKTKRLAVAHERMGGLYTVEGNTKACVTSYRDSLKYSKMASDREPGNMIWKNDLGLSSYHLGYAYLANKQYEKALKSFESSNQIFKELVEWDPDNFMSQRTLTNSYFAAAHIYANTDYLAANEEIKKSKDGFEYLRLGKVGLDENIEVTGFTPENARTLMIYATTYFDLLSSRDRTAECVDSMVDVYKKIEAKLPKKDYTSDILSNMGFLAYRIQVAISWADNKALDQRRLWYQNCFNHLEKAVKIAPENPGIKSGLKYVKQQFKESGFAKKNDKK